MVDVWMGLVLVAINPSKFLNVPESYPKAQNSPKASSSMAFGPKRLKHMSP